jgi:hypothetical protein
LRKENEKLWTTLERDDSIQREMVEKLKAEIEIKSQKAAALKLHLKQQLELSH